MKFHAGNIFAAAFVKILLAFQRKCAILNQAFRRTPSQRKGIDEMKKWICMLLAALTVLSLAACGGNQNTQQENGTQQNDVQQQENVQQNEQTVDLKQAAEDAIATLGDELPLFPVEDADELEGLYPGLAAVETKQIVAYQPPVSGFGCELVMVEVASAADVETVRGILQQRVDSMANDTTYPENTPAWKNNSAVTVNGNYVVMGVLPEGVTLPAAFKAEF